MDSNKHVFAVSVFMLVLLVGAVVGFSGGSEAQASDDMLTNDTITVYYSQTCGCCIDHANILEDDGNDIRRIVQNQHQLGDIKENFGIPRELASCHTMEIEDYIIEGHVPNEAIEKLLEEEPDIDGIALPDMPQGSPGMPGRKVEDFTIYQFDDGDISEFMII